MVSMGPLRCLRDDLPPPSAFTVTELPHVAKLDQNEAPVDVPADLKRELVAELATTPWNRYPQPAAYVAAKRAFGDVVGVDPDRLVLTVGADQTILLAMSLAGGPGRRARWYEPTYPYVGHAARLTHTDGGAVSLGPERDAGISVDALVAAAAPGALDVAVFVAPNNPTGGMPPRAAIDAALADDRRLVFVDEAYADFSGHTLVREVDAHPNLAVGRSLSKALLAAARLGYLVAHPEIVAAAEQLLTAPYHLNALHLVLARRFADVAPHVRAAARAVIAERARVAAALAALPGVTPHPSHANFILFAVDGDASAIHGALARAGVRIRDVSRLPGLAGHLRVTIGTPADNDAFLTALAAAR